MKKLMFLVLISNILFSCGKDAADNLQNSSSVSGSYTKMMIVGDYIYAIHDEELTTLDIIDKENPKQINIQNVGFKIENIFHQNGVLFIGAERGLTIYSIGENGIPEQQSQTNYFSNNGMTSCDPVIVNGNYAYVTLNTVSTLNSRCWRQIPVNELRIYDVSDIKNPLLLSTTFLEQPKGLSIDGDYLFICEGQVGISIINISDPNNPETINTIRGFETYDIITRHGLMMIVCPNIIRQYNYSDINQLEPLSNIYL